jgi:Tfp pilus assembly protein PilP
MKTILITAVLAVFAIAQQARGQDEMMTPSQKTKEAVEKLQSAPASAGEGLGALKDAAKAKLGSMGSNIAAKGKEDPYALPELKTEEPSFEPASITVERDPFRPFVLEIRPKKEDRDNLSPLERYEVGQLKLVGIIWDIPEPRAMVEDTAGLGYVVTLGTPIGRNDGKVKIIGPKEVVIEESFFDFYGARKTREVKLKLASE